MVRKIELPLIFLLLGVTAVSAAADQIVCDISHCTKSAWSAPRLSGAGNAVDSWAQSEIWNYIEDILQTVGLQPNFILIETTEVANAAALLQNNQRVLAYNPDWIKQISSTAKWPMYGLLAHELGHHLQGHTLLPGGSQPASELEADKYAGFVLANLGATEDEAISLWQTLPEAATATHPGRAGRIAAVRQGWSRAAKRRPLPPVPVPAPANPPRSAYLLPHSADRPLAASDLAGFSPAMLRIARNEIFARHGYIFDSEDLRRYFGEQPWYAAKSKDVSLTALESANIAFIKAHEGAQGGGETAAEGTILPHSSDVLLTRSEIEPLSRSQRRLARNEIFAHRGYIFNDPELARHFGSMRWYRPRSKSVELNAIEQRNVDLLRSME